MTQPAAPGRVLGGRYRIVELLARGGMASVWIAEDTLLARRVAVKTLHPELAVDDALRERFRIEAISAASVSHPGIVSTYDTGDDDGVAFIVMELVDGPTVRTLLDDRGRLSGSDAVRIARGVALALDQAHRGGLVHRDIKPANVLVPADGPVKVTDFGIAKADTAGDLTSTGTIIGTARYLAPEQVRGEPADARSDVYALGLMIYEMLVGSLPFHGDTEMASALARLSVAPDPLPGDTAPGLAPIVGRCLALDPADRYQSARALADALDAVAEHDDPTFSVAAAPPPPARAVPAAPAPVPAAPPPVPVRASPARPAPRKRRSSWPFALLGAGLLLLGAAGGYALVTDTSFESLLGLSSNRGTGHVVAPQVVGVSDFDPEGDGTENPSLAGDATDGDAATAWRTETYESRDFGGLDKSGVGLVLTLASPADVSSVVVDTEEDGWAGQVYVADAPAATLAGWGDPVVEGDDLGSSTTFTLDPPRRGIAVLVWITRLPDSGRLTVREVRVG